MDCINCEEVHNEHRKLIGKEEVDVKLAMLELIKLVKEQNEKINDLKVSIEQLKQNSNMPFEVNKSVSTSVGRSYANVTKEPVIIVKPVGKQNSSETIREIQGKIDPTKMAVGIEKIKGIREGGAAISCTNKQSLEKVKSKALDVLGDKYTIGTTELKNPRIIIVGVEEKVMNMTDEEIINGIIQQNNMQIEIKNKIKLLKKYMVKKNSGNIIFEVEADEMKYLLEREKLNVSFRNCRIYEYYNVIRCFNCGCFGHKKTECKNGKVCFKCTKNHENEECTADVPICINCKNMNEKVNLRLDINHSTFDRKCPCYERIIQSLSKKVKNYEI